MICRDYDAAATSFDAAEMCCDRHAGGDRIALRHRDPAGDTHACLREVEFVADLPKTPGGKGTSFLPRNQEIAKINALA